ncbi:MAG TPA: hypothetical protein VJY35_12280, partial [Candidatus Eisenbacteria bacterium]|nr:hypothetical protein [Candidatus Eisenbacteria bacterium]
MRAALALAILTFVPGLRECFEPPKAAVIRACGVALLVAVLGTLGSRRRQPGTLLDLAVLAWLAVEILATVFSIAPRVSVLGEPLQREGLLTSVGLAGLYFGTRATSGPDQPAALETTLRWTIVAAVIAGLFAIALVEGLGPLVELRRALSGFGGPGGDPGTPGPFGPFGSPHLFGVVAASAGAA